MTSLQREQFKAQHVGSFTSEERLQSLDLMDRFNRPLRAFEISEASLRDRIAISSSEASTNMAEQSIKESKRVILLTAFAFVFLPLSLASSIFGMNVRQINNSGPSIAAFLVTANVLCSTTFGV
ncbi:hypothetical protein EKO04_001149 [Ascochyta lentis]|uniref:Uncharacterized protein n=1 Tax=Ascochyta lentis TaxID=205686 RepID=A0A8H7JDF4_9PLEO|nr:hypothetical protein EKO04_001149 [Ascochyta lentis]